MTTDATLGEARADIHAAVASHDDAHRRRQYAASAREYAATVLLAADATQAQRDHARCYLDDANALLAA